MVAILLNETASCDQNGAPPPPIVPPFTMSMSRETASLIDPARLILQSTASSHYLHKWKAPLLDAQLKLERLGAATPKLGRVA
ncbi:hypothetical protein V5799_029770 [Amblyomma americanum]|uniref:Uncharacterized protein n=1 Tax=Amblyomma americanum TaxID=6943 RepID=A0AAQ4EQR6_AMBAM